MVCLALAGMATTFTVEAPKVPCHPVLNLCGIDDWFRPPDLPEEVPGGYPPLRSVTMAQSGSASISLGYGAVMPLVERS
jgi:hypothetical protein